MEVELKTDIDEGLLGPPPDRCAFFHTVEATYSTAATTEQDVGRTGTHVGNKQCGRDAKNNQ